MTAGSDHLHECGGLNTQDESVTPQLSLKKEKTQGIESEETEMARLILCRRGRRCWCHNLGAQALTPTATGNRQQALLSFNVGAQTKLAVESQTLPGLRPQCTDITRLSPRTRILACLSLGSGGETNKNLEITNPRPQNTGVWGLI